jgi:hypothetical protein
MEGQCGVLVWTAGDHSEGRRRKTALGLVFHACFTIRKAWMQYLTKEEEAGE